MRGQTLQMNPCKQQHELSPLSIRHAATLTSSRVCQWIQVHIYSTQPDNTDVLCVTSVACREELLEVKQGRSHSRFTKIAMNPLSQLKEECLQTWINKEKYSIVT